MKQQIYANIAEDIIEKIMSGHYLADEKLPSERVLCEYYGASVSSVKKALSKLIDQNYIYSSERIGYFVMRPKFDEYYFYYNSQVIKNAVITQEIALPPKYMDDVRVEDFDAAGLHALQLKKFMISNKTLIGYEEKYIFGHKNMVVSLSKKNNYESILANVEKYSANSEVVIDVGSIDAKTAMKFLIDPEAPFFKITKISYDKYGKIVTHTVVYYRFENLNMVCSSEYIN